MAILEMGDGNTRRDMGMDEIKKKGEEPLIAGLRYGV